MFFRANHSTGLPIMKLGIGVEEFATAVDMKAHKVGYFIDLKQHLTKMIIKNV